jgi:hypothetical protein
MKIRVTYDKTHNCLIGTYTGVPESENVKEYGDEIVKMTRIHNCKRFLNDLPSKLLIVMKRPWPGFKNGILT